MKDEDIQNLLGGFATDTLTDRERELLFTAALENQELFNALAGDQALRELLSDPAARRRLLQALQPEQPGVIERWSGWMRRPLSWAVAGSVIAALLVAVGIRQSHPPVRETTQLMSRADKTSEPPVAQVRDLPRAEVAPSALKKAQPAPAGKMKVAVLDFDAARPRAKEEDVGKAATDMLEKKLNSNGYTVIDRKQVDQVLQAQNLKDRLLDPSTAASVGRSVGADAVIQGTVTAAPQFANRARQAPANGPRPAAASPVSETESVQVKATAIDTQTAEYLAEARGQSGQSQQTGGLAGAVNQVANKLGQQFQQNARGKITGLVTEVNDATLTLNVGAKAGVKAGDRLEVRRDGKPIGRVVVDTVKDSSSLGAFQGDGPAKTGDTVASQ